ncbi:MAG TPA: adenosylcobinamide-GDP ribazoletransferase [Streptosporangiaceae bacterium]|jgi:adenosylcobinamide-GDP ribazoletransferase|nr:adenosylcobinamide-GDP ribazoletransferase [Streptosporangiaceae bacterium]
MVWGGLRLAGTLFTAIPIPGNAAAHGTPNRRTAAAAMYWAPVVGLLLGAAAAGVLLACRAGHSGPLLAAVLAIAVLAALTRGLHLDGLADFADGLGSRQPARRALEIMKQSDIGPFGVATMVLTVLIQVSALARAEQVGRGPVAVVVAAVGARLAMMLACRHRVPSARPDGLGAMVAGTVQPLWGGILVLAALAAAGAFGWIYPAAMAIALLISLALTGLATRRLGGITGDVLGAVAEVAAAACLLVTAVS